MKRRACMLALPVMAMLSGCAGPVSPPALPAALPADDWPGDPPARGDGRLYRIDAAASVVRIHVFRAGRAARLGHNHVLAVPRLQGWAWLPGEGLDGAAFALQFRLDELALDPPELRAALGPGWATPLPPQAVAATRANMLGEGNLQAQRHPQVRLRSLQLAGELPKLAVELETELHGQRRRQWLPLQVQVDGARLDARGSLVLRQSDFGIEPFSVLGGLLAVRDELLVEFELVAQISPSKGITSTSVPADTSP